MGDEEQSGVYEGGKSTFVARFLSTKHSWKGKYKRIFSIADNWYDPARRALHMWEREK